MTREALFTALDAAPDDQVLAVAVHTVTDLCDGPIGMGGFLRHLQQARPDVLAELLAHAEDYVDDPEDAGI